MVVLAPLGRYIVEHPEQYFAREKRQVEVMGRQEPILTSKMLIYYWRSLLGFNYEGDANSRFNVPFARHMGLVSGTLMVLGLGYVLLRWRHGYNSLLLAAWFILLLPTAVTMLPTEPPNIFRMSGTIGPALILAALPLPLISQRIKRADSQPISTDKSIPNPCAGFKISLTVSSATRRYAWTWSLQRANISLLILAIVGALLLAQESKETSQFYFHDYVAVLPDKANYSVAREMAREIERYADLQSAYIKVWPHWFDGNALRVSLRRTDRSWNPEVMVLAPDQPPLSIIQGRALFLLHPDDHGAMDTLRNFFPRGVAIPHYYPDGTLSFYAFYGER